MGRLSRIRTFQIATAAQADVKWKLETRKPPKGDSADLAGLGDAASARADGAWTHGRASERVRGLQHATRGDAGANRRDGCEQQGRRLTGWPCRDNSADATGSPQGACGSVSVKQLKVFLLRRQKRWGSEHPLTIPGRKDPYVVRVRHACAFAPDRRRTPHGLRSSARCPSHVSLPMKMSVRGSPTPI